MCVLYVYVLNTVENHKGTQHCLLLGDSVSRVGVGVAVAPLPISNALVALGRRHRRRHRVFRCRFASALESQRLCGFLTIRAGDRREIQRRISGLPPSTSLVKRPMLR